MDTLDTWQPTYDPANLFQNFDPAQSWFTDNKIAKAVEYFLWEFSNINSPQELLKRITPSWVAYYRQLLQTCTARRILIMGTGFGVLPLLAAAQDREVYACDRFPVLAKLSQDIINLNTTPETGPIKYFFKDIKELKIGEDLPEKCDLFIFDDFDNTLLETGFVLLLEHVKKHLLTPQAAVLPGKATVYARCAELSIDNSLFDLSPLAVYQWSVGSLPFTPAETRFRWLSDAQPVITLDFTRPLSGQSSKHTFRITAAGRWNAVVYWHDLFPEPASSLQYLDPLLVEEGREEILTCYQLRTKIRFEPRGGVEKQQRAALPSWHINMVNDNVRNAGYRQAITAALKDKGPCRVLDLGSGSGLLSLMAARANPQAEIQACEILGELSRTSEEINRVNGCAGQIKVIPTDIRQLKLAEKVDYVIHEVLASGMLGEGVLHFLDYAHKNLLQPGAVVIPRAARVQGMCIEHRLTEILGFNVEPVNAYRWHPDYSSLNLGQADYRQLSQPFAVFDFDFTQVDLKPQAKEIEVPVTAAGVANAVAYWFELQLDETTILSTSPFAESTCWNQAIQYLQGINVKPGDTIPLQLEHDCYKIHFAVQQAKLNPAVVLSPVPEYDRQWAARFHEIEKQYQEMIFKTASLPETLQVLVEAALGIAADPGQFGVRAKYASRLAESFFIR